MTRRERAAGLAVRLPSVYPDARCELVFANPLQLLVATILSAQCTDRRVNLTTPALFARCPTAAALAAIPQAELETLVHSTGFFRNKARAIRASARRICDEHGGEVPRTMESLAALPGVGRKTANVVLGNAFAIPHGVVVDTHVGRLARRLGLTKHSDPVKVERDLGQLFPRPLWTDLSHWLIFHGRRRCGARKPDCAHCELADLCPTALGAGDGVNQAGRNRVSRSVLSARPPAADSAVVVRQRVEHNRARVVERHALKTSLLAGIVRDGGHQSAVAGDDGLEIGGTVVTESPL